MKKTTSLLVVFMFSASMVGTSSQLALADSKITKETDCVKYAEEKRTQYMVVGGIIGGVLGAILGAGQKTTKTVGGAAAGASAGWVAAKDALKECQAKKNKIAKADPTSKRKAAGNMKMEILKKEERLLKMDRRVAVIKGDKEQVAMLDKKQAELNKNRQKLADENMSISTGPTMEEIRKKEQKKEDKYYRDLQKQLDSSS